MPPKPDTATVKAITMTPSTFQPYWSPVIGVDITSSTATKIATTTVRIPPPKSVMPDATFHP